MRQISSYEGNHERAKEREEDGSYGELHTKVSCGHHQDSNHEKKRSDGGRERRADEPKDWNEEDVKDDHEEKSATGKVHRNFDQSSAIEGKGEDVKHREESDSNRKNAHGNEGLGITGAIKEMKDLRTKGYEECYHRKEEKGHETE